MSASFTSSVRGVDLRIEIESEDADRYFHGLRPDMLPVVDMDDALLTM